MCLEIGDADQRVRVVASQQETALRCAGGQGGKPAGDRIGDGDGLGG